MSAPSRRTGSCAICHRRKVRCDKKLPCSTCVRTGVLCCYPSDGKHANRSDRQSIANIAARIQQLERTVVALSSETPDRSRAPAVGQAATVDGDTRTAPTRQVSSGDEILVQRGESSRYINEIVLSRVLEEEEEIQSVISNFQDTPEDDETNPGLQPLRLSFGPQEAGQAIAISDLRPHKWRATQLWQLFLHNVDPLIKILHAPTAEVDFHTAIDDPEDVSPDLNCLMFAICFAAVTSLGTEEAHAFTGLEKMEALNRFKLGLEKSMTQVHILETPTIRALQALSIFLHVMRAHTSTPGDWILHGLLIRAAQSLGLHRDGSNFKNMSPFNSEIRRRLWWSLWSHDRRAAEDHGMDITNVYLDSDVRIPLNVNDSALDPSMAQLPPAEQAWTPITFSIVAYSIMNKTAMLQDTISPGSIGKHSSANRSPTELIETVKRNVEPLIQYYNPVIPIQRATLTFSRIVLNKWEFVNRLQRLSTAVNADAQKSFFMATEENLTAACVILELNIQFKLDEAMRSFLWISESYPQQLTLLYVLWHLSVRPIGPGTERAWAAVAGMFELEVFRLPACASGSSSPRWAIITALKDKAEKAKAAVTGPSVNSPSDEVTTISGDRDTDLQIREELRDETGDKTTWDPNLIDWHELMTDFGSQDYDLAL